MNAISVRYALAGQLLSACHALNANPGINQFSAMSTMEIDYATETLRAWKRVCDGTSPATIRSVQYWGSLYCAARFDSESSRDGHLDADAGAELSWAESVLGGSAGALGEG